MGEGSNTEKSLPATQEVLGESLKTSILDVAKTRLASLKETIEGDPKKGKIKIEYDLSEHKKSEGLDKLLSDKDVKLISLEGSVDKTKHKKKIERLSEYVYAATKIEKYVPYFTEDTLALYEKNKSAIDKIKGLDLSNPDLKDSKEWNAILEEFGDLVNGEEGALNFILAFMRATDDQILGKIDKKEIAEGFRIQLKIGKKSFSGKERIAAIEIIYPVGLSTLKESEKLNTSIVLDLKRKNFWNTTSPAKMVTLFKGEDSVVGRLFNDLVMLKELNPDVFNYYKDYGETLAIISNYLVKYYSTWGNALPEAESKIEKYVTYATDIGEEVIAPEDVWASPQGLDWLSSDNFWGTVTHMNEKKLFRSKTQGEMGILNRIYDKIFNGEKVDSKYEELFKSLTTRLIEYENNTKSKGFDKRILQYELNLKAGS